MVERGKQFIEQCKMLCESLEKWLGECRESDLKDYFQRFVRIRKYIHEVICEAEKLVQQKKVDDDENS